MTSAAAHTRPERHLLALIESLDIGNAVPTERVLATELASLQAQRR